MKKKLYGLFIGINQYELPYIPPLAGCINDAMQMKTYLESQDDIELIPRVMTSDTDEKPTKEAMVKAIEEHLSQAGSDDIALLFFAGHGVQENTEVPAFKRAEPGGLLEALVCYDSHLRQRDAQSRTCLADKELRYLMQKVTQNGAHTVIITDCCHSGDIMRDSIGNIRRANPKAIPSRSWRGFVFSDDISPDELESKDLNEVLPLSPYVHLAACRDAEVAREGSYANGEAGGVFTINLLNILKKGGRALTYNDLLNRIVNYMRGLPPDKRQLPQIFTGSENMRMLYSGFLNGELTRTTNPGNIMANHRLGWVLDMGAIHGVLVQDIGKPVEVFDSGEGNESLGQVFIKQIFPGYSIMEDRNRILNPQTGFYRAELRSFAVGPLRIALEGDNEGLSYIREALTTSLDPENGGYIRITDEDAADYVVRARDNEYTITQSYDEKPLVEQIYGYEKYHGILVSDYLRHIARWEFLKNLNNPLTSLNKQRPGGPIEVRFSFVNTEGVEKEIELKHTNSINFGMNENGKIHGKVKISLRNLANKPLYCVLLYMPMTFGSYNSLLRQGGVWLEPGDTVYTNEGNFIDIRLDDFIYDFGWDWASEYLKLIVSTSPFDPSFLTLDELPMPRKNRKGGPDRGSFIISEAEYNIEDKDDWMATGYELLVLNPNSFKK